MVCGKKVAEKKVPGKNEPRKNGRSGNSERSCERE